MSLPHKNAEIIAQWAAGATIEFQSPTTGEWSDVVACFELGVGSNYLEPSPIHPEYDYFEFRVRIAAASTASI